jgi:hypothetical protein
MSKKKKLPSTSPCVSHCRARCARTRRHSWPSKSPWRVDRRQPTSSPSLPSTRRRSTGKPATASTQHPRVPPITGTVSLQNPLDANADAQLITSQVITGMGANAPNFPFPPFTGDNPNLWITLAEQYFSDVIHIHDSFWVAMSILHFSGAAGIWLQSVRKIALLNRVSFTSLLCTRFGRDCHQLLIRQFYTIK